MKWCGGQHILTDDLRRKRLTRQTHSNIKANLLKQCIWEVSFSILPCVTGSNPEIGTGGRGLHRDIRKRPRQGGERGEFEGREKTQKQREDRGGEVQRGRGHPKAKNSSAWSHLPVGNNNESTWALDRWSIISKKERKRKGKKKAYNKILKWKKHLVGKQSGADVINRT